MYRIILRIQKKLDPPLLSDLNRNDFLYRLLKYSSHIFTFFYFM